MSGTTFHDGRAPGKAVPDTTFRDVLHFWFGPPGLRGKSRPEWFRKDEAFDAEIRRRFLALHACAALGKREGWRAEPHPMLALVIVLDQFSRNLYRGDARAFAQDGHALACAREALARGDEAWLLPVERQFLYVPFEHSEHLADQDRAVDLMRALEGQLEARSSGPYALGDEPTLADICIVPQVANAHRLDVPMNPYPRLRAINDACLRHPAFDRARPEVQPDAE